jgi:hypothetical protein
LRSSRAVDVRGRPVSQDHGQAASDVVVLSAGHNRLLCRWEPHSTTEPTARSVSERLWDTSYASALQSLPADTADPPVTAVAMSNGTVQSVLRDTLTVQATHAGERSSQSVLAVDPDRLFVEWVTRTGARTPAR